MYMYTENSNSRHLDDHDNEWMFAKLFIHCTDYGMIDRQIKIDKLSKFHKALKKTLELTKNYYTLVVSNHLRFG